MVTWVLFLGIGLIIGIVAGLYFARLDDVSNKQKKALQQKLDTAEQQLKTYQSQVTEHFLKTASLVNSMTESYKAVHEHLAVGATELCDREVTVAQLEMPATKMLDNAVQTEQETEQQRAESAEVKHPEAEGPKSAAASAAESTPKATAKPEATAEKQTENAEEQEVQAAASEEALATKESAPAQQSEASAEQPEESKPVEAIQPPSTPESLHVDESTSDKSHKEPEQTTPVNVSRMVH
jgi:uncharacterized membrane-anchored protein YhcB (DUF1043 family)